MPYAFVRTRPAYRVLKGGSGDDAASYDGARRCSSARCSEQSAIDHLWFHGWDMDWEELTEREGLKVFARAKDSTLYDVRGRDTSTVSPVCWSSTSGMDAARSARLWPSRRARSPTPPARITRRSHGQAGRNTGAHHARRPQPRLLLFRWIRSGRDRAEDRQAGASVCAGFPGATKSSLGVAPITG